MKSNMTITPKWNGSIQRDTKILEELNNPLELGNSGSKASILSLSRRSKDHGLLLGFLGDRRRAKKDAIPGDRSSKVSTRGLISITINLETKRRREE